ncbi:acylphosphatase [Virgibacillus sp. CBA3643]|uniref:acylphosphatase n=1 Tax=Virgibacillus sp. CBA3643 TaxID=2942278 RepID=UPI0035A37CAC
MEDIKYRWLPHHEGAVPPAGQGKRISTYTVALEGWRRGLGLTFYSVFDDENHLKVRYSISSQDRTHYFTLSMGDKVSDEAFAVCEDKELTKQHLLKGNVPVPQGKMFEEHIDDEEIISSCANMRFPLVVKPTNGNAGKGVFANIQSLEDFRDIVSYIRHELNYPEIIVEDYIPGEEFRIVVIEDRVLGAMNRRPTSVVGDGIHSIKQLIYRKNQIRKMNPHLTSRLIKVDREVEDLLHRDGHTLKTVPEEGERVFLREKSNLSAGGDAIDVTDELTPELKNIAINAGKAIPGLAHYGVDMIVDKENNTGVILEVNARPGIGGHLFPMEGRSRDFAKDIIDYYFPETINSERSSLYFDFDSILDPIKKRTAENVEVSAVPPLGKLYGKKYIVTGKVQVVGYRAWIKRQALKRNLHGYTENLDDGTVVVVVAGINEQEVNKFKNICFKGPEKAEVTDVTEFIWDKPVKIGFEIRKKELSQQEVRQIEKDKERIEREKAKIEQEKEKIEKDRNRVSKKYSQVLNSRMWRYTAPVRRILDMVKKPFKSA